MVILLPSTLRLMFCTCLLDVDFFLVDISLWQLQHAVPGIDNWVQSWVSWVKPGLPRKSSSQTQKTELAGFINIFLCEFELG